MSCIMYNAETLIIYLQIRFTKYRIIAVDFSCRAIIDTSTCKSDLQNSDLLQYIFPVVQLVCAQEKFSYTQTNYQLFFIGMYE